MQYNIYKINRPYVLVIEIEQEKWLALVFKPRNKKIGNIARTWKEIRGYNIRFEEKGMKRTGKIERKSLLRVLKNGKPNDIARQIIFSEFGLEIFGLTDYERRYFTSNFKTAGRLWAFLRAVKAECRYSGVGFTSRQFEGGTITITPTKIKKALRELWNEVV